MEEGGEEASSHHCFDFRWAHVFHYLTFLLRQDGQRCLALACVVCRMGNLSVDFHGISSLSSQKKIFTSKDYIKVGVDKTFPKS